MASIIPPLFRRKKPVRMDQNGWADQFLAFGGNMYPIGGMNLSATSNAEPIDNNFEAYVNQVYKSDGILFAVCVARMMVGSQIRFQYQRMNKGRPGVLFGTRNLSILENPWDNAFTSDLVARAFQHADLGGNHYAVTEGGRGSNRLRVLRPDWTDIILTKPPAEARKSDIAGYLFRPGGTLDETLWETFPIDGSKGTVAHWAPIPDPDAQYRGMSWITPILEEVKGDKAIMKHKRKFFENGATFQTIIGLKDVPNNEAFQKAKEKFAREHMGVDNAYKTLFVAGGVDAKVLNADMQQLDFINTGGHGETRICAAGRVPPVLVQIMEALRGTPLTGDNFKAAKQMFIEMTMLGLWQSLAQSYSVLVPQEPNARLWFDTRDVAFLRENIDLVAQTEQKRAATIASYIQAGFTPDSSVDAVVSADPTLLKHTGLVSVQLFEPGAGTADPDGNATTPNPNGPANQPAKPANAPGADGPNNGPDKPGRPKSAKGKRYDELPSIPMVERKEAEDG